MHMFKFLLSVFVLFSSFIIECHWANAYIKLKMVMQVGFIGRYIFVSIYEYAITFVTLPESCNKWDWIQK